jgi:hypothetical protein
MARCHHVGVAPGCRALQRGWTARLQRRPRVAIVYRPVAGLRPYDRNARTHSRKQVHQIAASIRQFGFTNPVLIDGGSCIIAGHGRVQAAKQLGMDRVPTVLLEHLSEAELRAYRLADNRLAEKAGWDPEILKIELQGLAELELDFDLEITGFQTAEIDLILDGPPATKDDPADACRRRRTPPRRSRVTATCGSWGRTACCAATRAMRRSTGG